MLVLTGCKVLSIDIIIDSTITGNTMTANTITDNYHAVRSN
ncbi:hypothetical protein [Pectobacterium carotovorum]|nr:hypothetical protein [Pectobacterium carotovorum]